MTKSNNDVLKKYKTEPKTLSLHSSFEKQLNIWTTNFELFIFYLRVADFVKNCYWEYIKPHHLGVVGINMSKTEVS